VALKSVDNPAALHRVFSGHRGGCGDGLAGASNSESYSDVEAERSGVTVGGVIGKREPARRQEQVCAIFGDGGDSNAGHGAVFFIEEQARVSESEGDVAVGRDGSEELDVDKERILIVALEGERLAFGTFDFLDD